MMNRGFIAIFGVMTDADMSSGRLLMIALARVDVARFCETFSIMSSS